MQSLIMRRRLKPHSSGPDFSLLLLVGKTEGWYNFFGYIRSITNISGKVSNGIINATETVQYTDGTSGTEYFTAVRK
jgi:hypothetical protein